MDKIHIIDLKVRCIVGINEHERLYPQEILLNLTLHTDIREAAASDNIDKAVDYKKLKKRLMSEVEASSFQLVEALTERIAEVCLEDSRVERVNVRLEKPGALRFARSVGIEIVRGQGGPAES